MKFINKYQIAFTIVTALILLIELLLYISGDISFGINVIIMILLILFAFISLFVLAIHGLELKKYQSIIFVITLIIEYFSLFALCIGVADKHSLSDFTKGGYTKTIATVVKVEDETKYINNNAGHDYLEIVQMATWEYDDHYKTEEDNTVRIGDTKTIYYNNANPSWTRWEIDESSSGKMIFVVIIIIMRAISLIVTLTNNKKELTN